MAGLYSSRSRKSVALADKSMHLVFVVEIEKLQIKGDVSHSYL